MDFFVLVMFHKVLFFKIRENIVIMKGKLFQHQIISTLSFLHMFQYFNKYESKIRIIVLKDKNLHCKFMFNIYVFNTDNIIS